MTEIYKSQVSYLNSGLPAKSDVFNFVVTDGTNDEFVVLQEENGVFVPKQTSEQQV